MDIGLDYPRFPYTSLQSGDFMTFDIEPALTVKEVASLLNVDEKTIYRLAQKGELPGFKVAGAWRFQRADIRSWIHARKGLGGSPDPSKK
jgi:excisionase family DNA binding protein